MAKKKKEPNTIVFYHGKCTDGFTAAWAAWKSLKRKAEYVPLRHGEEIPNYPECVKEKIVYFLDFCPEEKVLKEIQALSKSLLVLDHHKTMEEKCGHLTDICIFDMSRSGAGMAWDHFSKKKLGRSLLVEYVQDRDIWNNRLVETEAVNLLIFQTEFSFENWDNLHEKLSDPAQTESILEQGRNLVNFKKRIIDSSILNVQNVKFLGYENVPVVNFSSFLVSDILNQICEEDFFAVSWHVTSSGMISYSLRSRGDFDVAMLAQKLGGGGHKNAAAFRSILYPNELKE